MDIPHSMQWHTSQPFQLRTMMTLCRLEAHANKHLLSEIHHETESSQALDQSMWLAIVFLHLHSWSLPSTPVSNLFYFFRTSRWFKAVQNKCNSGCFHFRSGHIFEAVVHLCCKTVGIQGRFIVDPFYDLTTIFWWGVSTKVGGFAPLFSFLCEKKNKQNRWACMLWAVQDQQELFQVTKCIMSEYYKHCYKLQHFIWNFYLKEGWGGEGGEVWGNNGRSSLYILVCLHFTFVVTRQNSEWLKWQFTVLHDLFAHPMFCIPLMHHSLLCPTFSGWWWVGIMEVDPSSMPFG